MTSSGYHVAAPYGLREGIRLSKFRQTMCTYVHEYDLEGSRDELELRPGM